MNAAVLVIASFWTAPARPPEVQLLTMGWGPELDHRYGHAAMCVVHPDAPKLSHCFNYGAAAAGSVWELAWGFLRGTAKFELVIEHYDTMLNIFRGYDRTIWVQKLPFTPKQARHMIRLLESDIAGKNRFYTYHHIDDNCSTRLRDHIDTVTGGRFRRGTERSIGITYRELGRRGLSDRPLMFFFLNILMGRRLDRNASIWSAMALPAVLRREVHRRLGAEPVVHYRRAGPMPPRKGGWGFGWIVLVALILALPVAVVRRVRRFGRFERWAIGFATVPSSLIGALIWFLAAVTAMKEMRINEALLAFWPTDFLMAVFNEPKRQLYGRIRLVWLAVVSGLLAVGVMLQPLLVILLIAALPCAAVVLPRPKPVERSAGPPPSHRPRRKAAKSRKGNR